METLPILLWAGTPRQPGRHGSATSSKKPSVGRSSWRRASDMRISIAILGLLVSLAHSTPAWPGSSRLARCYADCPIELTGCRQVFVKGRLYRECVRRILSACRHTDGCGAVPPPPPTERCRDDVFCPPNRPICDATRMICQPQPPQPPQPPPLWLPPGNYNVTLCADGTVTIPCQQVGMFPIRDRKSTRLNSSHLVISYAVFCLKKKK